MTTVKSPEKKMKSKSSVLVPCHRQAQDGLTCAGSTASSKRVKEEEASKAVVVVAEQSCFPPFDIVSDMLSRLPVKSLLRFRCVCKQWCSLTHDPDFVKDHHERALDRPALVSQISLCNEVSLHHFGDDGETKHSSFYSKFGGRKNQVLSNCINGLVCVSSNYFPDADCCYLLNLSTREVAELPRSASIERNVNVGLGLDVSTGEYKVARIGAGYSGDRCRCEVLSVGTREWRYVGDAPCEVLSYWPLFLNGAFHWIVKGYGHAQVQLDILVFDLRDEKIRMMPAPKSWRGSREWCMGLVASRGQLCIVWHSEPCCKDPGHIFTIWMLRDYTRQEWVKEYSVDISSFATMFKQFSIIAIRGHNIIFGAHRRREKHSTVIYSYDICRGTARELYRGEMHRFGLFTESLVSPRNLVGNLPL